jgi:hypothetical protein
MRSMVEGPTALESTPPSALTARHLPVPGRSPIASSTAQLVRTARMWSLLVSYESG